MQPTVPSKIKIGKGGQRFEDSMISALDTDQYTLGPDEVLIYNRCG
jgi:hypothetical protein